MPNLRPWLCSTTNRTQYGLPPNPSWLRQNESHAWIAFLRVATRSAIPLLVFVLSCPHALFGATSAAVLISPQPGSVLAGPSVTFTWSAGSGVTAYQLLLSSSSRNRGNLGVYSATPSGSSSISVTVTQLPTNGETVYARLGSEINGRWTANSYTFTAAKSVTPTLSGFSCTSASMTGAGTDACTVTLSAAAASGGFVVNLSSTSSAASVPTSVTVAAGATSVSFNATVSSVSAAQAVTLTADAGTTSKTFSLQLNAAVPTLSVNATTVAFGNVNLNTPSTQSVTLSSTGSAAVTVSSAAVTGTGFSVSGATFPLTLNPNQSATLSVQFDPTAAGAATGQLTITSNSSTNPTDVVSLSGTGQAASYEVNLSWNAPSSSSDPVAGYNVYRSPSGSSSYQLMGSVSSNQLAYTDTNSIQNGLAYDYMVESVDASGNESSPSNTATVSIP